MKAFEERLPEHAHKVKVGGLEYSGAYPVHDKKFFYHASPDAEDPNNGGDPGNDVVETNAVCVNTDAAFAPFKSARVLSVCGMGTPNHGTPVDFYSVHTYMPSEAGAVRIIGTKADALAVDPAYFADLLVNSHESGPDWIPKADPDSREMYRWGSFSTSWAADYLRRLLDQAMIDPDYAHGESLLSSWGNQRNFEGLNELRSDIHLDMDNNGYSDQVVPVATPIFRYLELAGRMSHDLAPIEAEIDAGVVLSGFRSREPKADRLMLYAHDPLDTGSRETDGWDVTLNLTGVRFPSVKVTEYRIDRTHPARTALAALGPPTIGADGLTIYGSAKATAVNALKTAAELVPVADPTYHAVTDDTLQLHTSLYSTGTVYLDIASTCGNGLLDPFEQCDDGDTASGDCCSSTCTITPSGSCPDAGVPAHVAIPTISSIAAGKDVAVQGDYAYLVTNNNGSGAEFYVFDISNPAAPMQVGSVDTGGDVNRIAVEGHRAYLATPQDTKELIVVDVTNKAAPAVLGRYNADETHDGLAVYAVGSRVYLGTKDNTGTGDNELDVLNATNPAVITLLGAFNVEGDVNDVDVTDRRAYLATGKPATEFLVLDVGNPAAIAAIGSVDLPDTRPGVSVRYHAGRAVGVTADHGTDPDVYVFDAPPSGTLTLRGSLDSGTDNVRVALYGPRAFVGTTNAPTGLQVVDVSDPAAPVLQAAELDTFGAVTGLVMKDSLAYLTSLDSTSELQVATTGVDAKPILNHAGTDGAVTTACLGDANTKGTDPALEYWPQVVDEDH